MGPSSKKLHKGNIWDFGTKLGLFWDHFYTLLGLLVVIFIKMPQNLQKGFKNRVVTTFNAKLTLFGDHFSVMFDWGKAVSLSRRLTCGHEGPGQASTQCSTWSSRWPTKGLRTRKLAGGQPRAFLTQTHSSPTRQNICNLLT